MYQITCAVIPNRPILFHYLSSEKSKGEKMTGPFRGREWKVLLSCSISFIKDKKEKCHVPFGDLPLGPARISGAHGGFLWHRTGLLTYQREPDEKNNGCETCCTKEANIAIITISVLKIKKGVSRGRMVPRLAWTAQSYLFLRGIVPNVFLTFSGSRWGFV